VILAALLWDTPRYLRRSPKVTEADLRHSTILMANLWVKKCSNLVSEGTVY
jgi:hypothetical protein